MSNKQCDKCREPVLNHHRFIRLVINGVESFRHEKCPSK